MSYFIFINVSTEADNSNTPPALVVIFYAALPFISFLLKLVYGLGFKGQHQCKFFRKSFFLA